MKILMINSVCGIRSTGRICTDLADALTEKGHTVKIAYGRESVPEKYQKYAVRIGSNLDVKLHGVKARFLDASGFGSKRATIRFIDWVKKYDPDIIHLHNIHGYYINIEVLFNYLRTCDKKIIWTLHDCWAFTGHCAYFTMAECDKWRSGCIGNCPCKKDYPKCSGISKSAHNLEMKMKLFSSVSNMTVVTPSKWLAGLAKQSFLKKYPFKVIYNGIDTETFKATPSDFRKRYDLQNKRIILGVASIWDKRKGLNDFIRLSEILDSDSKIVLVGLNEKQIPKVPDSIIKIRRTNSTQELAEIYTAADVFFNPTYEDNYPTTNLESIACGTPVVTYDTGGSPESGMMYGSIINQGDITALYDLMIKNEFHNNTCKDSISTQNAVDNYLNLYIYN